MNRQPVIRIRASPRRAALTMFAGLFGLAGYLVAMHGLIVTGAHPAWTFALILAPWGISCAAAWLRGPVVNAALTGLVVVVLAGAAWLVRGGLSGHVEVLLYVENLVFVASLSGLFGHSLFAGREPMVTRLARLVRGDDMPPAVLRYTRSVTFAWTIFFAAFAALSTFLFVTQSREAWSTFVNLLQWPAVLVAFAAEYVVRVRVLRGIRHSSPMAGLRTFARRDDAVGDHPVRDAT